MHGHVGERRTFHAQRCRRTRELVGQDCRTAVSVQSTALGAKLRAGIGGTSVGRDAPRLFTAVGRVHIGLPGLVLLRVLQSHLADALRASAYQGKQDRLGAPGAGMAVERVRWLPVHGGSICLNARRSATGRVAGGQTSSATSR
jgi:hypothetical protein